MNEDLKSTLSKVPEVTLIFWIIKIAATTLGETGGDAVSMTLNWGYALSSTLFIAIFGVAVAAQIAAPESKWGANAGLKVINEDDSGVTISSFKVAAI